MSKIDRLNRVSRRIGNILADNIINVQMYISFERLLHLPFNYSYSTLVRKWLKHHISLYVNLIPLIYVIYIHFCNNFLMVVILPPKILTSKLQPRFSLKLLIQKFTDLHFMVTILGALFHIFLIFKFWDKLCSHTFH